MMRGLGLRRQGSWVINIDHVSADRCPPPVCPPLDARRPPHPPPLPPSQAPSSADVSDELITEAVFSTDTDGDGLPHQLFNAAVHGNHPLLVALLDRKVDPNVYRSDHGTTALIAAAGAGHAQCVETLLECGANPSAKNSFGETAESVAKTNGVSAAAAPSICCSSRIATDRGSALAEAPRADLEGVASFLRAAEGADVVLEGGENCGECRMRHAPGLVVVPLGEGRFVARRDVLEGVAHALEGRLERRALLLDERAR